MRVNYDIVSRNIKYSIAGIIPAQDFISMQKSSINSINSFQLFEY